MSSEVRTDFGCDFSGGEDRSVFQDEQMKHSHKYAQLGDPIIPTPEILRQGWMPDGTPITPEVWNEFGVVLHILMWFAVLASPRIWPALRRIPPKTFLLELVDAYLVYARSNRHYAHSPEFQRKVDLTKRSAPVELLRNLLVDWEPPIVTPEIREAALAVHIAEFGSPPVEGWDDPQNDPIDVPLEATLIWPEGEWDEEAFLAGRFGNESLQ
jgi:hypothetical protein